MKTLDQLKGIDLSKVGEFEQLRENSQTLLRGMLEESGGKQKDLARGLRIDPAIVCHVLAGRRKLSRRLLLTLVQGTQGES